MQLVSLDGSTDDAMSLCKLIPLSAQEVNLSSTTPWVVPHELKFFECISSLQILHERSSRTSRLLLAWPLWHVNHATWCSDLLIQTQISKTLSCESFILDKLFHGIFNSRDELSFTFSLETFCWDVLCNSSNIWFRRRLRSLVRCTKRGESPIVQSPIVQSPIVQSSYIPVPFMHNHRTI